MSKFIFCFLLFLSGFYNAQIYKPVDTLYHPQQVILLKKYLTANQTDFINSITDLELSKKSTVKNLIKNRKDMFDEMLDEKLFLLDEFSENYVQNIFNEIVEKNNLNIRNFKVILTRDTNPNAISLGNGLIFVNISLFCRMESKDEIKFILAHELAHQILKHLEISLKREDSIINSDEFQTKLKIAKKNKISRAINTLDIIREYQYNDKKFARTQEKEADNLGFTLFQKVSVNKENAIIALKKLDSISTIEITQLNQKDYQDFFSTPNLEFNEAWQEIFGLGNYNYSNKTTDALGFNKNLLKSHPDLHERISLLQLNNSISQNKITNIADSQFISFKEKMLNETLYSYYVLKQYGKGLYFALQLKKISPNNLFAVQMFGEFLQKLAEARKKHTFKKVVDNIDFKNQSNAYYQFLAILENISTAELEELSTYYLKDEPYQTKKK